MPSGLAGVTDRAYTGHRSNNLPDDDLGLIYMNARFYLPGSGRFASADTIVPDPADPQSVNRYSYSLNNPLKYRDLTGHCAGSPTDRDALGNPNTGGNEDAVCWQLVWQIYGEWNRNSFWRNSYGSLEKFWELAHIDGLDFQYWTIQYENHGGYEHWDQPTAAHALADYQGGVVYKNPMRSNEYCHHPGCHHGQWTLEMGLGPVSLNTSGELEIGYGLTYCLGPCAGAELSAKWADGNISIEKEWIAGIGAGADVEIDGNEYGLLLMTGVSLQTDYASSMSPRQSLNFITVSTVGPLIIKVEYR